MESQTAMLPKSKATRPFSKLKYFSVVRNDRLLSYEKLLPQLKENVIQEL
jgi:hypothetical protein